MHLTEAARHVTMEVRRDGAFESLGLLSHHGPSMLAFLEHEDYLPPVLANDSVSAVIATEDLAASLPNRLAVAATPRPRRAFYELHNYLATHTAFYWTSVPTRIAASARIHPRAYVAERDVQIGERVVIEPNATVLERVVIDDDVIIRAGAVVGSQGFQFPVVDGEILPIAHGGGVRLHARVEIQSNACVDRGLFGGFTELGEDTKVDNLVHVAHDVRLGRRCRVVAGAMVAGSVQAGDDVWIGPSASVSSELTIGERGHVTIGSVATKDVAPDQRVTGNFAIDHDKFIAFLKRIR